jgi:hypothetical protein
MITGRNDLTQVLISAGANAVLIKPFRPRKLRTCLVETLGMR